MSLIPRLLIAGKNGQVARALQDRHDVRKVSLTALSRDDMDISSADSVQTAFEKVSPDILINAAAYTAVDQAETEPALAHAVNAQGAGNLAAACAAKDIPILHLSTDYVFDGAKAGPYTEADPVSPLGVYGASKLAGEEAVAAANPKHLILRTAWVYSPYGKNFVKTMLKLAKSRDEVSVVSDQFGNPTSAHDIADGLLSIASKIYADPGALKRGTYHMSADGQTNWADLARCVFQKSADLNGPVASVNSIATAEYPTPVKRPQNSCLDCTKLEQDYAIRLGSWKAGVETCVEHLLKIEGWSA